MLMKTFFDVFTIEVLEGDVKNYFTITRRYYFDGGKCKVATANPVKSLRSE